MSKDREKAFKGFERYIAKYAGSPDFQVGLLRAAKLAPLSDIRIAAVNRLAADYLVEWVSKNDQDETVRKAAALRLVAIQELQRASQQDDSFRLGCPKCRAVTGVKTTVLGNMAMTTCQNCGYHGEST
jgi:hypothetical protein